MNFGTYQQQALNIDLFCPALMGEIFYPTNSLSRVNEYIEPMAIFTA